jgi:hypothetical protein
VDMDLDKDDNVTCTDPRNMPISASDNIIWEQ